MMLRLLNNTTFSTAIHRAFDIIKSKNNFLTFIHLDPLCDVDTAGENDIR